MGTIPDETNSKEKVLFRPLNEDDRDEIKSLHESWFPVKYSDQFYNAAVRNKTIAGDALYSCVAVVAGKKDEESIFTPPAHKEEAWGEFAASVDVDDGINFYQHNSERSVQMIKTSLLMSRVDNGGEDYIGGCIIGSFVNSSQCHENTVSLLIRDPESHTRMLYIMTLGTADKYRNCGLATTLVEMCTRLMEQIPSCGVIYLHVITHNVSAITFYEKLGFHQMEEIKDYYTIDGERHNCYLYAKFINGNYRSLYTVLYSVWQRYIIPLLLKRVQGAGLIAGT